MSNSDWHPYEALGIGLSKVFHLRSLLLCGLILTGILGGFQQPASAASVCGWFTVLGASNGACFPTPMEACKAQHAYYNPTATFQGYKDTSGWETKKCVWPVGGVLPASTIFTCHSGNRVAPGRCVDSGENHQQRDPPDPCGGDDGKVNDVGATIHPPTKNPIDIRSGSKFYEAEDFRSADGSLVLARKYRSLPFGASSVIRRAPRTLGANWQLDFNHELHIHSSFGVFAQVELHAANGASYSFVRQSNGAMVQNITSSFPNAQTDYTQLEFVGTWPSSLSSVPNMVTQWKLKDSRDRVWLFESYNDPTQSPTSYGIARPKKVTFRGGLEWTFTYGSNTQLTTITDSFGKSITFDWIISNSRPLAISQANLPDGSKVKYIYEAINSAITTLPQPDRLIRVEKVNSAGTVIDSTTYHYENASLPTHVTGVSDGALNRLWTVTYDSSGRATQSTRPNGVDSTSVAYGPPATVRTRTVTNALGKQTVYTFTSGRLTAVDGTASTNCVASTRSISYNSNTFISSTTDEEGRVTNYTRDTRGRPTQIVDGVGTPSARTRTYTWHATFDVPTQIVEPGLTTALTWNTAGQLTQVIETDTTTHTVPYSTNGQTRTWAYTYTTTGGYVATVDGPLSGTGDTVTYAYNANGYLQSVTNEVGHVTEFTAWNGRGQPTSMTDPNGVVSTLTYDDIGRFKSQTVDPSGIAALTSVDYDSAGRVSKITRPNGAFLEYTWDGSQRLSKVTDNTGAFVEYDRDALSGVTARRIKTSGGTTLLAQTATYDELGRLLTFVGAASQTWRYAYDKTDNAVSLTDPRSNVLGWAFDSLNRLIRETDEGNAQVNLTRNGKDEVTVYSDPRSLTAVDLPKCEPSFRSVARLQPGRYYFAVVARVRRFSSVI